MRTFKVAVLLIGTVFAIGAFPERANADPTLDWVFTRHVGAGSAGTANTGNCGLGTRCLFTVEGDMISGDLFLLADTDGVSAFVFSMLFDRSGNGDSAGFQDELDLVQVREINTIVQGTKTLKTNPPPVAVLESTGQNRGEALIFSALTTGTGINNKRNPYLVGNFTMFVTPNVRTEGNDIFVGLFGEFGSMLNNELGLYCAPNAAGCTRPTFINVAGEVNLVPEPGMAALLGFGLLGAVGFARRGAARKR